MKFINKLFIISILFLIPLFISCAQNNTNVVITTFYANDNITRNLLDGCDIEVECLIKGAIEPHDFEPTAKQRAKIEDSKLLIVNGLGLEEYLSSLESNEKIKAKICYSNKGVDTLDNDPHTFVSPLEAITITTNIYNSLIESFPDYKDKIKINKDNFISELETISNSYKDFLSSNTNTYITGHTAYSYLVRDYNMKQKSVLGLSDEEASPSKISEICDYINENNIKTIYGEYFEENDTINAISKTTKTNVSYLYTLEMMDSSNVSYLEALKTNLENLKKS